MVGCTHFLLFFVVHPTASSIFIIMIMMTKFIDDDHHFHKYYVMIVDEESIHKTQDITALKSILCGTLNFCTLQCTIVPALKAFDDNLSKLSRI